MDLYTVVDHALDRRVDGDVIEPFLPTLARPERGVLAVLFYGSCQWPAVRKSDSEPDFLVIVRSHAQYGGVAAALVGWLPPTVRHLHVGGHTAKVCVVSARQLARETSPRAHDLHLAGRLSKRLTLLWSRNRMARHRVVLAQVAALRFLAPLARAQLGHPGTPDELMRTLLALSYRSELRVAEDGKVDALFTVERNHYRALAEQLLHVGPAPRHAVERCLKRSRRRAILRWPKYIFTFDGWLEYALAKLERAGRPVELTARERRHPLLYGWPRLLQLARSGSLR